jgi:NAD(P)-dependent dehydrogenase (short-subunit alcohol dehydrogenase family)
MSVDNAAALADAFRLDGKRVWVTGASRGLGRAIALGLASVGADVALTSRSLDSLKDVGEEVEARGGKTLLVPADVANGADVAAAGRTLADEWGSLDVLVNCAGISPTFKRAEHVEEAEWRSVLDVNISGTFMCMQQAAQLMAEPGGGSVVNISSIHGQVGMPRMVAYSASKGAIDALTRTLALEWAERGIRVNAVSPGYFETDMTQGLRTDDHWRTHLLNRIPMGRFGVPAEVVSAVQYLASPASNYVTGSNLVVDGGWAAA